MRQSYKLPEHWGLTLNHQETTNLTLFISLDEADINTGEPKEAVYWNTYCKSNKDQTAQFSHLNNKPLPRVTLHKSKLIMLCDLTMTQFRKALEFFSLFLYFHLEKRQLSNQHLTDFPMKGEQTRYYSGRCLSC